MGKVPARAGWFFTAWGPRFDTQNSPMLRSNIIANFLGKVWPSLLGLILVPVYLRYLGIEAYGLIGFFVALQGLIGFLDFGLSTASNREVARIKISSDENSGIRDLVRTFEIVYWGVALLILAVFILASGWLAENWIVSEAIPTDVIRSAAVIFGVTLALRWPVALYSGVLRGLERQVLLNLLTGIVTTLRNVGAAILVAFVSQSILAFLLWQLGATLVEIVVMVVVTWKILPARSGRKAEFHFEFIRKVGRFGLALTVISILASVFKQFDRIAITRLVSLEAVGYYVAAYTVYELLSYFVSPVVDAAFPRFSALLSQGDTETLAKMYHQTAQVVSFLIAPAAVFVSLFAYDILLVWTRSLEVAEQAHLTLSVLALAYTFNAMMHIPIMLQYAAGDTSIAMGVNVFGSMFLLPLMYLVVNQYGIAGAGFTWLAFNLLYYLITPHFMHRRLLPGHKGTWIVKDTLAFILLAWVLMGGAYIGASPMASQLVAFSFVCLAGLIYLLVGFWVYPSLHFILPGRLRMRWNGGKR